MTIEQLKKQKEDLISKIEGANEEEFAKIKDQIAKIDYQISLAENTTKDIEEKSKNLADEEMRAARLPIGKIETTADFTRSKEIEACEKRGKALKDGAKVSYRAVTLPTSATATTASKTITPAFEQVGTIDEAVQNEAVIGSGAGYKVPFEKTIGMGGITAEGTAYTDAEPTFDYADIRPVKVTAYAEISEECVKLPNADYDVKVEGAVRKSIRRKLISQIFNGTGTDSFVGIFNAPEKILTAACKIENDTIDIDTLDNFIFNYGGDETVEGDAVIFMNKLTMKEFAKVKDKNGNKVYDIKIFGDKATINTIPVMFTSEIRAFNVATAGEAYLAYGKLNAYDLVHFSDIEVERSKDYKFKEGMIAYKANAIMGGSPIMYNGFVMLTKANA